jgi:hypothetical protein
VPLFQPWAFLAHGFFYAVSNKTHGFFFTKNKKQEEKMIILMNKNANKEQVNLLVETLERQNLLPIYIKKENAISALPMKNSVDISSRLIMNLPGIEKIIDYSSDSKMVN